MNLPEFCFLSSFMSAESFETVTSTRNLELTKWDQKYEIVPGLNIGNLIQFEHN